MILVRNSHVIEPRWEISFAYPGIIATLSALYVTFSKSFRSRITFWKGSDIKFNARLVKITEYSVYCPKSSFGTLEYESLGVSLLVAEKARSTADGTAIGRCALFRSVLAADCIMFDKVILCNAFSWKAKRFVSSFLL